jgi:SAM-dependent methyltransferase
LQKEQNIDAIYYAHGGKLSLAKRVSIFARDRMYEHFIRSMMPDRESTVLDFGVSEDITNDANALERRYPFPQQITCAGLGDGNVLKAAFPAVHHVTIQENEALPFKDKQFTIAYSNAVFEHLGSDADRRSAVVELLRVAQRIYLTVPNRWFPMEHHTGIPLLHFHAGLFRKTLHPTRLSYWTNPRNQEFISKRRVARFMPAGMSFQTAYCGVRFGPFSSNLAIWSRQV